MATNIITYISVIMFVAIVVALQVTLVRGNISLLVLLSFLSAIFIAMYNMRLKYERFLPVALVFISAVFFAIVFTVGMILS